MQKETYKIKCPKHIVFGDPLYFEEYPDIMHRTMTIFLAPHDHINVYLSNHKYKVQQEATKVIGVDTARYLFEVDGRYEEIRTMADGVWVSHQRFTV